MKANRMSEQVTPEQASQRAAFFYQTHKTQAKSVERSKAQAERARHVREVGTGALPINVVTAVDEVRSRERSLEHNVEQVRQYVSKNLDAFRDAALGDAALAGVEINLQHVEDPGQPIVVRTPDHQ